jgi:hypothetical protein
MDALRGIIDPRVTGQSVSNAGTNLPAPVRPVPSHSSPAPRQAKALKHARLLIGAAIRSMSPRRSARIPKIYAASWKAGIEIR